MNAGVVKSSQAVVFVLGSTIVTSDLPESFAKPKQPSLSADRDFGASCAQRTDRAEITRLARSIRQA